MGLRYYCDYCDKTFIDDVESRKRHLQSSIHIKLKKEHYDSFESIRNILKSESTKIPCQRFFQNDFCQFSSCCKYTHYTPEQLYEMKLKIQEEIQLKKLRAQTPLEPVSIDSWQEMYNNKTTKSRTVDEPDSVNTFWVYPDKFKFKTDLPPSLKPFDIADFKDEDFAQWGPEISK